MEHWFPLTTGADTYQTIITAEPLYKGQVRCNALCDPDRKLILIAGDAPVELREELWFHEAQHAYDYDHGKESGGERAAQQGGTWARWLNKQYQANGGRKMLNGLPIVAGFAPALKPTPALSPVPDESETEVEDRIRVKFAGLTDPQYVAARAKWTSEGLDPEAQEFRVMHDPESGAVRLILHKAGMRAIADRCGDLDGIEGEEFTIDPETNLPEACYVTVYRRVNGVRKAFIGKAVASIVFGHERDDWTLVQREHPHKCLAAACLRDAMWKAYTREFAKAQAPVDVASGPRLAAMRKRM